MLKFPFIGGFFCVKIRVSEIRKNEVDTLGFIDSIKNMFSKDKEIKIDRKVTAVIVAAGSSSRMGGQNKLLMEVFDIPILAHTLLQFNSCEYIDEIIIVCREMDIIPYGDLCKTYEVSKVSHIIKGGQSRTHSCLAGVSICSSDSGLVAIHDGARPLVTNEIISNTIELAAKTGAAAPAVAVKDSIKLVKDNTAVGNVDRDSIVAVQTPQVFDKDLIKGALSKAISENIAITDDCSAVELLGIYTNLSQGSYDNIKVTTPEDIYICEAIMQRRMDNEQTI